MTIIKDILNDLSSPKYSTIIIHRHQNPDPDALGSQGGLQKILQASFPNKQVYAVGEEVASLRFIHVMDEIEDEVYENALVIVTDTGNTDRISDKRYEKGAKLIKIDHHPDLESYGDLSWVDTSFSSASEMIYFLVEQSKGLLQLNTESSRLLFAGIVGDTGRFLYNNTKPSTLQAAAKLIQADFSPQDIYQNFYQESLGVTRFKGYIMQHFNMSESGVAYMRITEEMMNNFGIDRTEASNLVYTLSNIEGVRIWVFFVDCDDQIRVRIRSKQIDISGIARKYNGGGHSLASGAVVYSTKEIEDVISDLEEIVQK